MGTLIARRSVTIQGPGRGMCSANHGHQLATLEDEQQTIRNALSDAAIYVDDPMRAAQLHQRDAEIEDALMLALERWEALSATTTAG